MVVKLHGLVYSNYMKRIKTGQIGFSIQIVQGKSAYLMVELVNVLNNQLRSVVRIF
jgi:hypothetical protein